MFSDGIRGRVWPVILPSCVEWKPLGAILPIPSAVNGTVRDRLVRKIPGFHQDEQAEMRSRGKLRKKLRSGSAEEVEVAIGSSAFSELVRDMDTFARSKAKDCGDCKFWSSYLDAVSNVFRHISVCRDLENHTFEEYIQAMEALLPLHAGKFVCRLCDVTAGFF